MREEQTAANHLDVVLTLLVKDALKLNMVLELDNRLVNHLVRQTCSDKTCKCIYCKGAFIVCCNRAMLPMYQLLICHSSTQHTASQAHFLAVPQCSNRRRDGISGTAAYCNAAAVDYERSLSVLFGSFETKISNPITYICMISLKSEHIATLQNLPTLQFSFLFTLLQNKK